MTERRSSYLVHPQPWAFPESRRTTYQCKALIFALLLFMLQIYYGNPCKHACSHQIHIQCESGLLFLYRLNGQLRIEPFALLDNTSAGECVAAHHKRSAMLTQATGQETMTRYARPATKFHH